MAAHPAHSTGTDVGVVGPAAPTGRGNPPVLEELSWSPRGAQESAAVKKHARAPNAVHGDFRRRPSTAIVDSPTISRFSRCLADSCSYQKGRGASIGR